MQEPPRATGESQPLNAGVVLALRAGLAAWAAIVVTGLAMALITRDTWILGFLGFGEDLAVETARQALAAIYARFEIQGESFLHGLHLTALAPALAAGLTARRMRASVDGLSPAARLAWSAAAVVPFLALCTPLVALAEAGPVDVNAGSVLLYSTMLVGGASVVGAVGIPGRAGRIVRGVLAPLATAVLALSVVGALLIGGLILTNQVPRLGWDLADLPNGPPEPALLELDAGSAFLQSTLVAGNYGTGYAAAGMLAEGKGDAVFPITDARYRRLHGFEQELYIRCLFSSDCGAKVRLFDGSRELPPLLFLLAAWLILVVPWSAAVFAGFSAARVMEVDDPARGMAWGAVTGPIWAFALTLAAAAGSGGSTDVPSTFIWTLIVATVLGAVGGRLAAGRSITR